jgi:hypothetical protein
MARCGLVVEDLIEVGTAASADSWPDLDVLITAAEPVTVAEDFARRIGSVLSPVFAASRGGDAFGYCVRLVLRDLRMIDVTASAPAGGHQDPACAAPAPDPADAVAGLVNDFRFDAVLAAEPACGDILIGALSSASRGSPAERKPQSRSAPPDVSGD